MYLGDPELVDEQWRNVFDALPVVNQTTVEQPHSRVRDYFRRLAKETTFLSTTVTNPDEDAKQVKVLQLINAYRFRGHQHANLDPLGLWQQERVPDLAPEFHNLTEEDFDQSFNVGSFAVGQETMKLSEIYEALKQTYCGSIGAEYMHITDTEEKRWIQQRLESVLGMMSSVKMSKSVFLKN